MTDTDPRAALMAAVDELGECCADHRSLPYKYPAEDIAETRAAVEREAALLVVRVLEELAAHEHVSGEHNGWIASEYVTEMLADWRKKAGTVVG